MIEALKQRISSFRSDNDTATPSSDLEQLEAEAETDEATIEVRKKDLERYIKGVEAAAYDAGKGVNDIQQVGDEDKSNIELLTAVLVFIVLMIELWPYMQGWA